VEPGYLLDSKVFCFQPCLYPMKNLHHKRMYTNLRGGVQRGVTPFVGFGGKWAPDGGSEGKAPEGKIAL
jgi:hypothetical protein